MLINTLFTLLMLSGIIYNTLEINQHEEFKWIRILSKIAYATGLLVVLFAGCKFLPIFSIVLLNFLLFVETGLTYPKDVKEGEKITKGEGTAKKIMCVLSILSIIGVVIYSFVKYF